MLSIKHFGERAGCPRKTLQAGHKLKAASPTSPGWQVASSVRAEANPRRSGALELAIYTPASAGGDGALAMQWGTSRTGAFRAPQRPAPLADFRSHSRSCCRCSRTSRARARTSSPRGGAPHRESGFRERSGHEQQRLGWAGSKFHGFGRRPATRLVEAVHRARGHVDLGIRPRDGHQVHRRAQRSSRGRDREALGRPPEALEQARNTENKWKTLQEVDTEEGVLPNKSAKSLKGMVEPGGVEPPTS